MGFSHGIIFSFLSGNVKINKLFGYNGIDSQQFVCNHNNTERQLSSNCHLVKMPKKTNSAVWTKARYEQGNYYN